MKRAIKDKKSPIKNLVYQTGKVKNNNKIRKQLLKEQHFICAYTETYLDHTSSQPIEHFDPTLKHTTLDGYKNYFVCKDQWNNEKGTKVRWLKFQPILHPTSPNFNSRVIFYQGDYFSKDKDAKAQNLIDYLKLNDLRLSVSRKKYIKRKQKEIEYSKLNPQDYFDELIEDQPEHVYFIRAVEEFFNIIIKFSKS